MRNISFEEWHKEYLNVENVGHFGGAIHTYFFISHIPFNFSMSNQMN